MIHQTAKIRVILIIRPVLSRWTTFMRRLEPKSAQSPAPSQVLCLEITCPVLSTLRTEETMVKDSCAAVNAADITLMIVKLQTRLFKNG